MRNTVSKNRYSTTTANALQASSARVIISSVHLSLDVSLRFGSPVYQIHREAIIMERLTASPHIVDVYGHCATSIMAELMVHEVTNQIVWHSKDDSLAGWMNQTELDKLQQDDVRPMNNLTNELKLELAIAMAESIAEIHGFEGGVIIHGDIHPVQYLANDKGQIKLNDFNSGEILEFNPERQEYCKVYRCFGGTYRSPEEFRCMDSNEGMDTYAMANNIYILLTGLWPFYQYDPHNSSFVQDLLIANEEKPHVDPRYRNRSATEAGLVVAMEKAWEWDLDKRESIFDMLRELYALRESATLR
jgi:serine/threonine protein kinase